MKGLISILPYVLLPLSMAAALTVVLVAALKALARCFPHPTAAGQNRPNRNAEDRGACGSVERP